MSAWHDQRNAQALVRLRKALPAVFPAPVLIHAVARSLPPSLPRLAVESYWRHHAARADRLAKALAVRTGAVEGWVWAERAARRFRLPPAPFRDPDRLNPGRCCVCGQPVFRFGWHRDLWADRRRNRKAGWHAACVAAWHLWTAPAQHRTALGRLQRRRCAVTGKRLLKGAEVDHRVPLFQVWREHRDHSWPALLDFWGVPNLQVINRSAHAEKSSAEASARSASRHAAAGALMPAGVGP